MIRVTTRALPRAAWILVLVVFGGVLIGTNSEAATPPTHYIYAGDPIALDLDVSRLAVRFYETLPAEAQVTAMEAAGVRTLSSQPTGVESWSLIDLRDVLGDAGQASREIERLAASPAVEFVSPVLLNRDGMSWIPTRDILLRVKPEYRGEAEAILFELAPELEILSRDFGLLAGAFELRSPDTNGFAVLETANRLAGDPRIAWAQPDPLVQDRFDLIPNDALFGDLWGIRNTGQFGGVPDQDMDGDLAWDITTGDPSVIVMVMDTGVQLDHPDLNLAPGRDFTPDQGSGGPMNQCDDHGTLVAGCISAVINNSIGVVGIAPDCKVASARIGISNVPCDGTFQSQTSWKVSALAWAVNEGFSVSNASFSGSPDNAFTDAYINAREHGVTHFASTGNNGQSSINYPASIPEVNAVGALNPSGTRAGFSNYGTGIAFSAPGQSIRTTAVGNSYALIDGTSFSAPYAAGVAALVKSMAPPFTAAEVEARMQETCRDLGAGGYDTVYGWGFVNALNAANILYVFQLATTGLTTQIGSSTAVVSFAAEAENLGVASDTYDVSVSGVPAGWTYSYTTPAGTFSGPSALPLASGATAPITIDIDSQGNPGSAYVQVTLASQGDPGQSRSVTFLKLNSTQVLIVDDDGGATREVPVGATLTALGTQWGHWDVTWGALTIDDLNDAASCVIWLTGDTSLSLDAGERALIGSYLAGGGRLLLSGQEIAYDLADPTSPYFSGETITWFVTVLHASYQNSFSSIYFLDGVPGDLIGDGLSLSLDPGGPYGQTTMDTISPGFDADGICTYQGVPNWYGGMHWTDGGARLVYLSFGLEGISEAIDREEITRRTLDWFGISAGIDSPAATAPGFLLAQASPNPFRPSTSITYHLPAAGPVSLRIYDVQGRLVRTLVDTNQQAMTHTAVWNGRDDGGHLAASGVYFARLEAAGQNATRRLVLLR